MEIWKKIDGFENYSVSNKGRVRNDDTLSILKQKKIAGYLYIILNNKMLRVHRLVAQAFIPNPKKLPDVNHKNEIKTDNCVENLEWLSHIDNCNYGNRNKKMKMNNPNRQRCSVDYIEFDSINDAAKYLNLGDKRSCLYIALRRGQRDYKGHKISYIS